MYTKCTKIVFVFGLGSLLQTPKGELLCSPDLLVDWEGDTSVAIAGIPCCACDAG